MTGVETDVIAEAFQAAPFKISRQRWRRLGAELRRRGDGTRESGAFLLADREGVGVLRIAYYDDLDAHCLTGGISFATSGFTELWRICRAEQLRVVADVHTHPSTWVGQSKIDSTNPMLARVGHVAIIVPSYGDARHVEQCGVHIYLGDRQWISVPPAETKNIVTIHGAFSAASAALMWSAIKRIFRRGEQR